MSLREKNNAIAAAGLFVIVAVATVFTVITYHNGLQKNKEQFSQNIRKRRAVEAGDDCLWSLTAKEAPDTLTSPNYPDNYPRNADCHWLITADDPGATISLKIRDLVIETEARCRLDYLTVYLGDTTDSPSLDPLCGQVYDRLIETNSSRVLLEFHSDTISEEKGFSVSYFTRKVGGCPKSITDESGTLKSPGFPANYPDDFDCWTLITAGEDKKVTLVFDFVDLEFEDSCTFDYVRIFDGETENSTLLDSICQESEARTFESSGSSLLVHFHSDDMVNRKGYRARYTIVDRRSTPVGDCLWETGAENGTITSPGYPDNYPSSAYCNIWILAPENRTVSIDIDALLLEMNHNCSLDYLLITEGPSSDSNALGQFCGLPSEPKQIVSSRHEVRIQFQSDNFAEFSGFKLRYRLSKEESVKEEAKPRNSGTLSFSAKPSNTTLPEGSSSLLPCSTPFPDARIRWLKDDKFLSGETPLPGLRFLPNNSLWIQSMDSHLTGVYTCIVVSPEVEEASSAYVSMIADQPCNAEYRKTPSDSLHEENDFAFLACLSGGEQTVLSWEKDGQPLVTDDRVTLLDNGYVSIQKIRVEDAGTYTCVATDTVSGCRRKASAVLTVNERIKIEEVCGQARFGRPKKVSQSDHGKILGGNDAPKGAYPWQVMLWSPNPMLGTFCGGTLINERWVVTAAHCLINQYDISWDSIRILLGKHERERGEPEMEFRLAGPSSMRIHPTFRKLTFDNDVALLRLNHPVRFTDRVLPVCLGDRNVSESLLLPGTMGTVIGWGRLKENGAYPKYLQEIRLPVVDHARCKASTNFTVTRNMFCAGYAQEVIGDACSGDSGGPFLVKHEDRWHITGIVSWGDGCGKKNKFGFYTRIANQLSWIQSVIQQ